MMINKENLRRILDDPDYRPGKVFAVTIQVLVVVSLIAYTLTTLPGLSPETRAKLYFLEAVTIVIFTVEYILPGTSPEARASDLNPYAVAKDSVFVSGE